MGIEPDLTTRTLSDTAQEHLDDHNAIHSYLNGLPLARVVPDNVVGFTHPGIVDLAGQDTAFLQGEGYAHPVILPNARTAVQIATRVATAGGAGSFARLGLYEDNDGIPGTLIVDAGTVTTASTGTKTITISEALPAGPVWAMILFDLNGGSACAIVSSTVLVASFTTDNYTLAQHGIVGTSLSTASLPDPFPTTYYGAQNMPLVFIKA